MNYRNRALLDLAYMLPCTFVVPGVCDRRQTRCVPCHSNRSMHGKGKSLKAHDCHFAAGCDACHYWYDRGQASREDKIAVFERASAATLELMWARGLIRVAVTLRDHAAGKAPVVAADPLPKIFKQPWRR